jgi:uncharacterized membrane protein YgaE (UPF0421/DUF939 family)
MACDFYIYTYLYVYFENKTSNIPILLTNEKCYFYDSDSITEQEYEIEIEKQLTPRDTIQIYSNNKFKNTTYELKYKEIIQKQLNKIDKNWENISIIEIVERRIERF